MLDLRKAIDLGKQMPAKGLFPESAIIKPHLAVIEVIVQTTQADGTKLIEVGGRDGQEFEPVKNSPVIVTGLVKNTVVEAQPAQVAADVITFLDLPDNRIIVVLNFYNFFHRSLTNHCLLKFVDGSLINVRQKNKLIGLRHHQKSNITNQISTRAYFAFFSINS